jgi:hypothetical protein
VTSVTSPLGEIRRDEDGARTLVFRRIDTERPGSTWAGLGVQG